VYATNSPARRGALDAGHRPIEESGGTDERREHQRGAVAVDQRPLDGNDPQQRHRAEDEREVVGVRADDVADADPPSPASAASTVTTSSGVEVPIATIVSPIVSSPTPNRRATRTVASTSARAPIHSPRTAMTTTPT